LKFSWRSTATYVSVKQFLFAQGISHNLWTRQRHLGGKITVNQQTTQPDHAVAIGDVVTLSLPNEPSDGNIAVDEEPIDVLMADENWLVVNKNAGVNAVPGPSDQQTTMVNRIKGWLVANNADNLVPHLITRLDRDTSGIMLVARNGIVQGMIAPQVDQHTMRKTYLALVEGRFENDHGVIDSPIGRVDGQVARAITSNGQSAITEYKVLEQFENIALVELNLKTGRTHQIRVHMQSIGHPLLGDRLYGGSLRLMQRQALHAWQLSFTDPVTQQRQTYTAPLPEDMQAVVNHLRDSKPVE
jgi:23S rRNA pseudouridine1911/1915/1917 synthase